MSKLSQSFESPDLQRALDELDGRILFGVGAPGMDAKIGTLYINVSGGATTTLYVKTATTAAGWTAK